MTRSAKGSVGLPGSHFKAKAGPDSEVRKTGWGAIRSMLECKSGTCVAVHPALTSQTCSECGVVAACSGRSQECFKCAACGYAQNADLSAVRDVLASATGATTRREALGRLNPVTREMNPKAVNV